MPEKQEKPEKQTQGQTLSLRISDALYARLERAKQLLSSKKGEGQGGDNRVQIQVSANQALPTGRHVEE